MKQREPILVLALALALAVALPARGGETPEELLKRAYQLDTQGDLAKVAEAYRDFLKKYSDHTQATDVRYRLAKALDSLGEITEAVPLLQAVTQPDKKGYRDRTEAFFLLGKIQAMLKNYDGATSALESLLSEGAGLHEDEALNLCGTYYALRGKNDEAAAKLNILKLKRDSPLAEQAAFKLAQLWLRAEKTDLAVGAIEEMAGRYPNHARLPECLVTLADLFRKQAQLDKAIAIGEQLKTRYPKSVEGQAANLIVGMCYRDRKEYQRAIESLAPLGRVPEFQKLGLASEALLAVAEIYFFDLREPDKAVTFYEEAARSARDSEGDRRRDILEQCYFRLGEYYFQQQKWSTALDYFLFLRALGTQLNVTTRIMACQGHLDPGGLGNNYTDEDLKALQAKIAANPGTDLALEAETFLTDRKMSEAMRAQRGFAAVSSEYGAILKKYPKELLTKDHLESYLHFQIGLCSANTEDYAAAVREFETALADTETPYRVSLLENIAVYAEKAGDKKKALATYEKLYLLTSQKTAAETTKTAAGKAGEAKSVEYLRALSSRSDTPELVQHTVDLLKKVIEEKGPLSDESREARYYLGELCFVKKDYSAAARAYKEFIQIYGPKLDADGNVPSAPWRPASVDAKVEQLYEAAVRIAHCWYLQGHEQNMVAAYQWLARNFGYQNRYLPEALYWLGMELAKGAQGRTKEGKRKLADTLWKTVVNPSVDFDAPDFAKQYYAWANPKEPRYEDAQKYVKNAMLRAGQLYMEGGDYPLASGAFEQFLERYPVDVARGGEKRVGAGGVRREAAVDEMHLIARYALGRVYVAMNDVPKLITCYKPYLNRLREDRFRVSALKILGYYCGKAGRYEEAIEAYAALLDEYGPRTLDTKGKVVPVPPGQRLRQGQTGWDGIRMDPPKDLDQGEIRFSLGYLYWKQELWGKAIQALKPFESDESLRNHKSRDHALYMVAQSAYKLYDYASGVAALLVLIRDHAKFEALEEAYAYTARGLAELRQWRDLDQLYSRFVTLWPKSDHRPRMDLYNAISMVGQGKADAGIRMLKAMTASDIFEDVKAEAAYQAGLYYASAKPPDLQAARQYLELSVRTFTKEYACLELAKVCMKQRKWEEALGLLQRVVREFPQGNRNCAAEAEKLLPEVQKELAQEKSK